MDFLSAQPGLMPRLDGWGKPKSPQPDSTILSNSPKTEKQQIAPLKNWQKKYLPRPAKNVYTQEDGMTSAGAPRPATARDNPSS